MPAAEILRRRDGTVVLPRRDPIPVLTETEVLVAGGGTAGLAAAIAAARNGVKTLLVERHGYLGGLATGGLIVILLTLDDGAGQQVVRGLCQEVVERLDRLGAAVYPRGDERYSRDPAILRKWAEWGMQWGKGPHHVRYSVAFDPDALVRVADEMVAEAGVSLLYHVTVTDALVEDGAVRGVLVHGKLGWRAILARVVIDCTGDGDVLASAGAGFEHVKVVPWLWCLIGGVEGFDEVVGGEEVKCFRAVGDGRALIVPWRGYSSVGRQIDPLNPEDLTWAEVACRGKAFELIERHRATFRGFRRAHICRLATQLGITESRRLVGEYVLTSRDANCSFPDAVGRTGNWTRYKEFYDIPYRCLLPREVDGLLVAGRCISVDRKVHHSTKEIPCCFVTGQAAGTAAALALRTGVVPRRLDVQLLRRTLRDQGVFLGDAAA